MIVEVSAPLEVKTENVFRSMAFARSANGLALGPHMQAAATRKMRDDVRVIMLSQIPKPPRMIPKAISAGDQSFETECPNHYHVTLTRIAPSYTDDDGLAGGTMKAVRDEVAAWLGVDDGHERIKFSYAQEGCPRGKRGLRIRIEDATGGDRVVKRELGDVPSTRELSPRGDGPKPKRKTEAPREQTAIVFRKCFGCLPWEQDGTGTPIYTPLAMTGHDPPKRIKMRVPACVLAGSASVRYAPGSVATFERTIARINEIEAFLYLIPDCKERRT